LALPAPAQAAPLISGRRALPGTVPAVVPRLAAIKALAGTNRLSLAIGLPLRNRETLTNVLASLYDPAGTNFHQWLSPDQFADRFGPTEEDYQKVIRFAAAHGLQVTHTHSNRALLDVAGTVTNIEGAFQVKLHVYQHPTENRMFYAPDTEPSIDTNVPILSVSGLDNYALPHRIGGAPQVVPLDTNQTITAYATGSSPGGYFIGNDFRHAYVPGVTNTGAGQYIAIVDVGGPYYALDVYMYETNAGLSTNIAVTNILLSGWSGVPVGNTYNEGEEVLDIDMAMSMAPAATILNYEGEAHDVFNQIALDDKAKQMTLSYGFGIDASIIQMFQQFAAQGQSFSQASGDGGADLNGGTGLTGNPYATIVGGVSLTTSGAGGPWASDTTWSGSGGGISGYGLPDWQLGIATTTNQGSTTYRNYPDVAMPAVNVFTVYENGTLTGATGGTSCASPLWAGFMALVNQQAATLGKPPAGFVNPSIYALGKGPYSAYTNCFHDITTGNNFNSQNPSKYPAGTGYDLCTGWGTPTGSNTLNVLAGIGTNDFMFYASQGGISLAPGLTASNTTIQVAYLNGASGIITLSAAGLPSGVTASFAPATTTNTSLLVLATAASLAPGTFPISLIGTSGGLTHAITFNLTVVAPDPGSSRATLSYNKTGIFTNGQAFGGGLDGGGSAYSANLLGSAVVWNNTVFTLGPANSADVVQAGGQTIALPAGNYNTLLMLATAVDGSQAAQTFTVTYTDNTTATYQQGISDWAVPQNYPGEFAVAAMSYRASNDGTQDGTAVKLYGYSFTLDQTRMVKSITLPNNADVDVLAITLANTPAAVPLATYYNRAGMYTDHTTFTNPATGGLDGGGAAYSATLLGGSLTWNSVLFDFGTPNVTNTISTAGQTVALPSGSYASLRLLGTGVQGRQVGQSFVVTYTDNSTTTFNQSLSDWVTAQGSIGESNVLIMGHRNSSNGTSDGLTCYLYGYTFKLNSSKTPLSFKLPSNANVEVLAISLVPNWPPTFTLNPFAEPNVQAGQAYSANVATNASDLNGDAITYAKVSGPAWLTVAANGALSGTPLSSDVGTNTFMISATDPAGAASSGTVNIAVTAAPAILSAAALQGGTLTLNWSGGIAPYQIQATTNLLTPNWVNLGDPVNGTNLSIVPTNAAMFYRITGQ
jgi:hypothetical protein